MRIEPSQYETLLYLSWVTISASRVLFALHKEVVRAVTQCKQTQTCDVSVYDVRASQTPYVRSNIGNCIFTTFVVTGGVDCNRH